MWNYVGIVFFALLLVIFIINLREHHSPAVYAIWYMFSLFFLVFLVLYGIAEAANQEVTDALGPSASSILKMLFDYVTDLKSELVFVGVFVYLTIGPQFLSYLLSGASGSATAPRYVRQITSIAFWSLIKFMAALSGLLLASALVKVAMGKPVSAADFLQCIGFLAGSFFLAAYHAYLMRPDLFEGDIYLHMMGGMVVTIPAGTLQWVHRKFTRHHRMITHNPDNGAALRPGAQENNAAGEPGEPH
jgi:hypothetical protein